MRGEYHSGKILRTLSGELPPHARRILAGVDIPIAGGGTTSACAENTQLGKTCHSLTGNYLRMRGEYSSASVVHRNPWELPPHARRIPGAQQSGEDNQGTTSACAENTCRKTPRKKFVRNYLRMRGEYP